MKTIRTSIILFLILLIVVWKNTTHAGDMPFLISSTVVLPSSVIAYNFYAKMKPPPLEVASFWLGNYHLLCRWSFTEDNVEYQETQLRRFETIFFISLPPSFLFSFLGFTAYRGVTGKKGTFTPIEYRYIIFSTIGISLSIAFNDNRITYRKELY